MRSCQKRVALDSFATCPLISMSVRSCLKRVALDRVPGGIRKHTKSFSRAPKAVRWAVRKREARCPVYARSSKIRAGGLPKSHRGTKNCFQECREQQVRPWGPSGAPILTLGRAIWTLSGFILELLAFILVVRGPFWVTQASILRVLVQSVAALN